MAFDESRLVRSLTGQPLKFRRKYPDFNSVRYLGALCASAVSDFAQVLTAETLRTQSLRREENQTRILPVPFPSLTLCQGDFRIHAFLSLALS